jgi:hypothetical protein
VRRGARCRCRPGTSSRNSSSLLAANETLELVKPVTLRLGRDILLLSPSAIGSPTTVITIGMSTVAAANTTAAGDVDPTITSGLFAVSSRASCGSRLMSPSAPGSHRLHCSPRCSRSAPTDGQVKSRGGALAPTISIPTRCLRCSAYAASGHDVTAPPSSVMNSRRCMFASKPRHRIGLHQTHGWGHSSAALPRPPYAMMA